VGVSTAIRQPFSCIALLGHLTPTLSGAERAGAVLWTRFRTGNGNRLLFFDKMKIATIRADYQSADKCQALQMPEGGRSNLNLAQIISLP